MKQKHIFLLLINIVFCHSSLVFAQEQEQQVEQQENSLVYREQYGLRLGIDLSKPLRTLLDENYRGFEVAGDYRIYEDYYLAGELGNESNQISEENVTATGRGSYLTIGADYNAYDNWSGMQNLIYVGVRYGFSSFSTELQNYSIYTRTPYFERDTRNESQEFNNLTANWLELQLGVKVEVLNNLYLGAHVQLKRRLGQSAPGTFDNLYIPGFNRTYDDSNFGAGYGYTISYLIPLYKM